MVETGARRRGGYPARLVPDNGEIRVVFRDLPEVTTWGKNEDDALSQAADAAEVVIGAAMDEGRDVPDPSAVEQGEVFVPLPAVFAAKLGLWRAWRETGLSKVAFAERLGLAESEVRRILDAKHNTKLDRLELAAAALGKRLVVSFEDAA